MNLFRHYTNLIFCLLDMNVKIYLLIWIILYYKKNLNYGVLSEN